MCGLASGLQGGPFKQGERQRLLGKMPGCADSKVLRGGQVTADRPSGEEGT